MGPWSHIDASSSHLTQIETARSSTKVAATPAVAAPCLGEALTLIRASLTVLHILVQLSI
jgi:hypothetical protein